LVPGGSACRDGADFAYVELKRVVDADDRGKAPPLADRRQWDLDTHVPVLRSGSAEVTRMFVTDELDRYRRTTGSAVELAERLAASFGVEAFAGFPEYTSAEWDSRPEWMRTHRFGDRPEHQCAQGAIGCQPDGFALDQLFLLSEREES
jgi:hypothetical protein